MPWIEVEDDDEGEPLFRSMIAVDIADFALDLHFSGSLILNGHVGYGSGLLLCTAWAMVCAKIGRSKILDVTWAERKRELALLTESVIFCMEDCTMILVIANVPNAYDASNPLHVGTVVASIVSALIYLPFTIWGPKEWRPNEDCWLPWAAITGFFFYLLIAILVNGGLDHLNPALRILLGILYGFQVVCALFGSVVLLLDDFDS